MKKHAARLLKCRVSHYAFVAQPRGKVVERGEREVVKKTDWAKVAAAAAMLLILISLANLYLTYAKLRALEEKLSSLENEIEGLKRDVFNALYYSQRATGAAAEARKHTRETRGAIRDY